MTLPQSSTSSPARKQSNGASPATLSTAQAWATALLSVPAALASGACLAAILPMSTANAIFSAGLLTPVIWVTCLVWGFLANGLLRVAVGLGFLTLASIAIVLIVNLVA